MIKVAVVGVGNCASSLVQSLSYCRDHGDGAVGVPYPVMAGYRPCDIDIVAAFDVDARKVGKPLSEAIFAEPNCTTVFQKEVADTTVRVLRGPELDGVSAFMRNQNAQHTFVLSDENSLDQDGVTHALKEAGAGIVISFLPVGSHQASEFYAQCALEAGCAFVNAIPVFLASDEKWASKFKSRGLPILGDDFKAQIGATIVHRALSHLFDQRGAQLDRSYQLNVGGNTDFLNMADADRLSSKRTSKTEAVQSVMKNRLEDDNLRIGPSDYVKWLNDQKVGLVRMEGRILGGVPVSLDLRLSVEDSPNAAAMALIALRCAQIALDRGLSGAIHQPSAFLFKHPPVQKDDYAAAGDLDQFISGQTD